MKQVGREYIGLKDKTGRKIYVGDIVRFYFCADHPSVTKKDEDCTPTKMVDAVVKHDGKFYFQCDMGGALAIRYNDRARVIGRLPKDVGLVVDEFGIVPPKGADRKRAIKQVLGWIK